MIVQIMKDLFTGKDNATADIGRVLWAISFVVGMGLVIFSTVTSKPFDFINYGVGVGGLLAAGAAALKLKETTEPKGHDDAADPKPGDH